MPSPTSCGFRRQLFATYARIYAAANTKGQIGLLERLDASSAAGERVFHAVIALAHFERQHLFECPRDGIVETRKET